MDGPSERMEELRRDGRDRALAVALVLLGLAVVMQVLVFLAKGELGERWFVRPLIYAFLGERLVRGAKPWARVVLAIYAGLGGLTLLLMPVFLGAFHATGFAGMAMGAGHLACLWVLFKSEAIGVHLTPPFVPRPTPGPGPTGGDDPPA